MGDVDLADSLHAPLAFLLLFEEFAFARNIAAVTFGENVFAHGGNGFACDDAAANGGLDRNFKHLARNELAEARHEFAASFVGHITMSDHGERIHGLTANQHIQFYEVGFLVSFEMLIK